jgi:hypothetical protein
MDLSDLLVSGKNKCQKKKMKNENTNKTGKKKRGATPSKKKTKKDDKSCNHLGNETGPIWLY